MAKKLPCYVEYMDEFEGHPVRHWDYHAVSWKNVADMTPYEAMYYLSRYANSDGEDWSARPQFAMACRIAVEAIRRSQRSDAEVLSEIICRGTRYDFSCYSEPGITCAIELHNPDARNCPPVKLYFDEKGNIL